MLAVLTGPTNLFSIGELVLAGVGLLLAYPAYKLARGSVDAAHTKNLAIAVADYLGIPRPLDPKESPPPPTIDRPSIRDLLNDLLGESAAATAEIAIMRAIIEAHLGDGHGAPIPGYLLRRRPLPTPPRRHK